ncbi:MAG TPA: nitrogen fixation protein [Thermopetrobacter sp.]|nr:nitrogen fixation protein [Thermopetrobacter sp.]
MRIAVTSQNFRTVTGHAGKARRFIIYEVRDDGTFEEVDRLDLPKEMSIHAHPVDAPHPLDAVHHLITAGCGSGFVRKMEMRGVQVHIADAEDPARAVGELITRLSGRTLH